MLNRSCLLSIKFHGVSLMKGLHTSLDTFLNVDDQISAIIDDKILVN